MDVSEDLFQCSINFFDKKDLVDQLKMRICHKPIIRKF